MEVIIIFLGLVNIILVFCLIIVLYERKVCLNYWGKAIDQWEKDVKFLNELNQKIIEKYEH